MCQFFSFLSNGHGSYKYFDWKVREKLMRDNPEGFEHDSHTSIASYYHLNEDRWNKYEYNPLTEHLLQDELVTVDDNDEAQAWVRNLDFKTIVPALIVKPIVNPLNVRTHKLTKEDIRLLLSWASVRASVWDSVYGYISSFFNIQYDHDFSPCVKLWERGFVPSFDGTTWRLHQGKDAKVVYTWKPE